MLPPAVVNCQAHQTVCSCRAYARASARRACQVTSSRRPIKAHSLNVRPAGANGWASPAAMSPLTQWRGSSTMRSPVRWSQVAKKSSPARRHGNLMSVPTVVYVSARKGWATFQKNPVSGVPAGRSIAGLRGGQSVPGPRVSLSSRARARGRSPSMWRRPDASASWRVSPALNRFVSVTESDAMVASGFAGVWDWARRPWARRSGRGREGRCGRGRWPRSRRPWRRSRRRARRPLDSVPEDDLTPWHRRRLPAAADGRATGPRPATEAPPGLNAVA